MAPRPLRHTSSWTIWPALLDLSVTNEPHQVSASRASGDDRSSFTGLSPSNVAYLPPKRASRTAHQSLPLVVDWTTPNRVVLPPSTLVSCLAIALSSTVVFGGWRPASFKTD